jgi:hypothetical protein
MKLFLRFTVCLGLLVALPAQPETRAAATGAISTGQLRPVHLRCDADADPLGVDVPQPYLSWQLESPERSQLQSAYRILVASSVQRLDRDEGDLWDSGRVASDETLYTRYAGKTLKSCQQAFWKVQVWDERQRASGWSTPARWTMGILAPDDWQAEWLCAPAATESLLLRKEFQVHAGLLRALVHVSGLGQYELSLNGVKAGDELLSPGWTDYNKTVLCDTRDVTALLRPGGNAVGVALGNGIYNVVRRNRYVKFAGSFGPLRAILQLRLDYVDGSIQLIRTDETWRTSPGPVVFSNVYGGEDYDARLVSQGWDSPGFDDRSWLPAVRIIRPSGILRGHSFAAPLLRPIEIRKPVEVRPIGPGTFIYDLGQNAPYLPRVRVSGPPGSTVRLTPAEILTPEGRLDRGTMGGTNRGSSWWQFTKGNAQPESWSPQFCYIGCRYLEAQLFPAEVDGELPQIDALEGVVVHSSAAPVGRFACSNELLNRIRALVRWAQRANLVSVLTDCPHREKLGWLEQYHLNGPSLRYEFDLERLFAKGVNDMADAQLDSGLVPNIAPEYTQFKGAFRAATEWGSAFIIVPWQQYQFTGDLEPLRRHYEAMRRYFAYLETRAQDGLVPEGLGDWYDLGEKKPGAAQLTPPPVTATAFYFYDAQLLAKAAALLQKPEQAADYTARAERIRVDFNRHFFHTQNGSYATGSQCANALALVLGLAEPTNRPAVLAALVADVEAHGCSMTAGDVGFRFLLQALAQGGRSDLVYRMINQDERPGYGYQLKHGATSLTESWDANRTSSHNHFMLGHIIEWFYKDLAGIDTDPAGPGFKKILIRPNPVGDLKWVEAAYQSVRGEISVRWEIQAQQFRLKMCIPANTTATVYLPASSTAAVTEGGLPANRSHGVQFLRQEPGHVLYQVASGKYDFASKLPAQSR